MRALRFLPMAVLATVALSIAPPAFASGGGSRTGGGGGGGGGGGSTTTVASDPSATLSASAQVRNQGGGTSIEVSGTVKSCSEFTESLYLQIEDTPGHLSTATLTPPNTAGGSCYICDSVLAPGKSWSFSWGWTVPTG